MGEEADSRSRVPVFGRARGLSRRAFLERAGLTGAAAVLAQIPGFLARQGWLEAALAAESDATRDTLNALVAFVVPGPDEYSKAQGQSSKRPGGIQAGTTDALIELLDRFVGSSAGPTLPSSGGVATLLNATALQVNPAASHGAFLSPFARLSFAEKVEVFHRLEQMTEGSELRFVSGIVIGAVAFLAYGEAGVFDRATGRLKATPVGWKISNYAGITEGRHELKGYWQGRRRVHTSKRYAVHRRRKKGKAKH